MIHRLSLLLIGSLCLVSVLVAQRQPLTYYLPDITYDASIPTPEDYLGWQIGEWHVSHDLQLGYIRLLANLSPRMTLTEYARTHEQRPLIYLTVTSPANHNRLPELKSKHLALSDPDRSGRWAR
ncbi:MAG: hypothetical protein R2795_22925 [Saprospiraceae bacterium]